MIAKKKRAERLGGLSVLLHCAGFAAALLSATARAAEPAISPDWDGAWAQLPEVVKPQLEACCLGPGTEVPLTSKYRAARDEFIARKLAGERPTAATGSAACMPVGMPGVMVHPNIFEILFTRDRATLILINGEVRRVWFGRAHPPADELEYALEGDSIGKWEKSTLVIDTTGISSDAELFMANGIRATQNTHVVERLKLEDKSTLRMDVTVTDPEIFTAPYRYAIRYKKVPGSFEVGCNNRDDGVNPLNLEVPAY